MQTNVGVSRQLAQLAAKKGFKLFYISTDYVFNGEKWVAHQILHHYVGIADDEGPLAASADFFRPPYEVDDSPDPLQEYGKQKRAGEVAILEGREKGAEATVLRIPLLYGRAEYNAESAVNILVDGESQTLADTHCALSHFASLMSLRWQLDCQADAL